VTGRLRRLLGARESGVVLALLLLVLIGALGTDGFVSTANLFNVGQQASIVGIMAVAMTLVIVCGEIDLSVGAIYALSSTFAAQLLVRDVDPIFAIAGGLLVGAAAGFVNGIITVRLGLPAFIVTLGTLNVFRGIALLMTSGLPVSLNSKDPTIQAFGVLGRGRLFDEIPMQLVSFIVVAVVGGLLLHRTRFGYHVYAVGGSREAARLVGIPTDRIRVLVFVLMGVAAATAGIIGLSYIQYVEGGISGLGLELTVITAVIVGGTALFGGSGTVFGTIIGVLFIGVLQNVLVLGGVSAFWQMIANGAVIVFAVALDAVWRRRRA
jgi:ribose transport system permease protein